jgi:hypothetical protein
MMILILIINNMVMIMNIMIIHNMGMNTGAHPKIRRIENKNFLRFLRMSS